ncbi:AAA family ATPase [Melghirimyces algeriensis]|uniref:Nuclease SbcCD subunit C n=1 Tax=Melghirimyces algeriensis TaxID=910412 RepID=A0A521C8U9_9BACL|nr:AAA family ATPase [Melghirimyces algeriensis]SMO55836.1 exonuclease SbcC [Melghirimyces algeriensis]
MKRFAKLVIENFQSHEYTEIHFKEGLNVLVGSSDSGKSAILRAIRWLLYNQPKGTDYIRVGKSRCRVSLTLSDGTVITRIRSSSVNRYILLDIEGNEHVFEGFGSNVPKEIANAHGMHTLKLDLESNLPVQFGTQLESPFLLSETGSIKAKSIGRVSGAHFIDMSLQGTLKDLRSLSSDLKYQKDEAAKLREKLKPYTNLPDLLDRLEKAETFYRKAEEKNRDLEKLQQLIERWKNIQYEEDVVKKYLMKLSELDEAEKVLIRLERGHFRFTQLKKIRSKSEYLSKERKYWNSVLEKTDHLNELQGQLYHVEKQIQRSIQLISLSDRLFKVHQEKEWHKSVKALADQVEHIDPVSLEEAGQRLKVLKGLAPRYQEVINEKKKMEKRLRNLDHLPVREVDELEQLTERFRMLVNKREALKELQQRIDRGRKYLADNGEEMDRWMKALADQFRRMGQCPTCGSEISQDTLEHMMREHRGGMDRAAAGREN